jgi:uncharacterized protein YdeI (YjbR/CyaY-like superfamily)
LKIKLNPKVDKYLSEGCMRCKNGGTPNCKVKNWIEELETLRQIVLESKLKEEVKWGVPVYTYANKNVASIAVMKDFVTLGFFKGLFITDSHRIFNQASKLKFGRIINFCTTKEILKLKKVLRNYIEEAKSLEI